MLDLLRKGLSVESTHKLGTDQPWPMRRDQQDLSSKIPRYDRLQLHLQSPVLHPTVASRIQSNFQSFTHRRAHYLSPLPGREDAERLPGRAALVEKQQ